MLTDKIFFRLQLGPKVIDVSLPFQNVDLLDKSHELKFRLFWTAVQ